MREWLRREVTVAHWRSNPFQLTATAALGTWSLMQLLHGVTKNSVLDTQIDTQAQSAISLTNLLGALICMVGLHMRDLATALWVEVIGYISLCGSLGIYLWLVADKSGWANSVYGYGLSWAFMSGAVIRTTQIFLLKRAERRRDELARLVDRVAEEVTEEADDDGGR